MDRDQVTAQQLPKKRKLDPRAFEPWRFRFSLGVPTDDRAHEFRCLALRGIVSLKEACMTSIEVQLARG